MTDWHNHIRRWHLGVVLLASLGISFLVYANSLWGEFVIDDYFFVDRPQFTDVSRLGKLWIEPLLPWHREAALYRPLIAFTMAVQLIVFGKNTFPFHLVSVIANGLVVFLVYLLTKKLFSNGFLAIATAVLFAVLPIHTEAVAYIKARDEIFSALFALSSWVLFVDAIIINGKHRVVRWNRIYASSILLFLAMLCKEFSVGAWVVFLAVDFVRKRINLKTAVRLSIPFILAVVLYSIMRYVALGDAFLGDDIHYISNPLKWETGAVRIWTPFLVAYIYISKTFVPLVLSASYHFKQLPLISNPLISLSTMTGIIFIIILLLCIVHPRVRTSSIGIGAMIFLLLYFPFSQFIQRGGDIVGERWMYLPSYGLVLIATAVLEKLYRRNRTFAFLLILAIAVAYSWRTIERNRVWQHPETLYLNMIQTAPNSIRGYVSAGYLYLDRNKLDLAWQHGQKALTIYDKYAPVYDILGGVAYKRKQYDEARMYLEKAHVIDPEFYNVYMNLARVYYLKGEYDKAYNLVDSYFSLSPVLPELQDRIFYAYVLAKTGRFEESLTVSKLFLSDDVNYPEVQFIIAVALYHMGEKEEAKNYFYWRKNTNEADLIREIIEFPAEDTNNGTYSTTDKPPGISE